MTSLLAIVAAVVIVQSSTLYIVVLSEEHAAQERLDVDLGMLRFEIQRQGSDWRLIGDGLLTVNGKPVEGLDQTVEDVARITNSVATVFAGDTRIATTVKRPDGSPAVGTKLAEGPARTAAIDNRMSYRGMADILGVRYYTIYEPLPDREGRAAGILFVGVPSAQVNAAVNAIVWRTSEIALAVVLISAIGIWLILRATLSPLQALAGAVHTIGDGRLDVLVPCAGRTDQLGEIGRAVETLREKAHQARATGREAIAQRQAQDRRQAAIDLVTQDFGTSLSGVLVRLVASAGDMRESAVEVTGAAQQTRGDMEHTTLEAEMSSRNLARVAAAAEELTASVSEISRQVDRAATAAREAEQQAHAADATVRGLGAAASQIDQVVGLIDTIAAQTDLLALNATIEAARAGDAGKGFAVVAGEVRQLATKTAAATRQIGLQVGAIQGATGEAANAVTAVTTAIGRVSLIATEILTAVEQQGFATAEIAAQVVTVSQATEKAAGAMRAVSKAAEKSSQISQTTLVSAEQITDMSATLRKEVGHFMMAIRNDRPNDNRRQYERIAGGGTNVELSCAAHATVSATVIDISLGGAALACDWRCAAGTEIGLRFLANEPEVPSRVVNVRDGKLGVAFSQDPRTLVQVSQAIDRIVAADAKLPLSRRLA
jgi:methyl-accepting chemotaxis protein